METASNSAECAWKRWSRREGAEKEGGRVVGRNEELHCSARRTHGIIFLLRSSARLLSAAFSLSFLLCRCCCC